MSKIDQQQSEKMLKTGLAGSVFAAICCFTPVLLWTFGAVGLAGIVGGLDYILFPMLFASLGLVAQALYAHSGSQGKSPKPVIILLVIVFSTAIIWLQFFYAIRISIGATVLVAIYWLYLRAAQTQSVS
ncbi:MAG: mercury resistance system transport protein MerF [Rhizobiaceae bacterium]|nr:mercury resistance system transport protein MerF [Rhizobiaceae bacterium]